MTSGSSPSSSSTTQAPASCRGRHLICELYGADRLDEVEHVRQALEQAARSCGATVLDTRLHPFEEHGGVTGVVLLAESHVTIHTWPEHGYAAVDVFLCGDCAPKEAIPILEDAFLPETVQQATFERGRPSK